MALGLGIDTGGTYTDGVLYDFDEGRVLASEKRRTTPHDLSEGIRALLDALDPEMLKKVGMVSLSTTLATNACVEGRGSRAALLLYGYNPILVERLRDEYGLGNATELHVLTGSHTQRGNVAEAPDWDELDALLDGLSERVDAVGVCEYWGVRDPAFEIEAKRRVREATGLPVAAAHELTDEINSMRRAATTLLNARLISLIDELLKAVGAALRERGVCAPLMVVRGDGSLMTEAFARECPVETMLSGPAASVVGAMKLSGERDMIAVDLGGTTADLAIVRDGRTVLARDGVDVGAWRTGTRAIGIKTIGLGGDTGILWNAKDGLRLDDARALPLCALASEHPEIKDALRAMLEDEKTATYARGEFFTRNRRLPAHYEMEPMEKAIYEALEHGPLDVETLSERVRTRPYFLRQTKLETMGVLLRSRMTPTDLMHLSGDFTAFDREASELGLALLAKQTELSPNALAERAMDMAGERLYGLVANMLMERAGKKRVSEPDTLALGYHPRGDELRVRYCVAIPLVGIGAPARALTRRAAKQLEARLVLPEEYAVANAVGAITGSILVEERVEIKPHYDSLGISGYSAHASTARFASESLEECEAWARETAIGNARARAKLMGAANPEVEIEIQSQSGLAAGNESGRGAFLLAKYVLARATGRVSIT